MKNNLKKIAFLSLVFLAGVSLNASSIEGKYELKEAGLKITKDLLFNYDYMKSGMCLLEGQLVQKGKLYTYQDEDIASCKAEIRRIDNNTISFDTTGCPCGMSGNWKTGNFKKKK